MRIIGGRARGLRIHAPRGGAVRPTSDRIKESVFNILSSAEGRSFLDLFAGSGNMGLEALSRGASRVVFVEQNRRCVEAIRRNLVLLKTESPWEVIESTVERGLKRLEGRSGRFDVIFADPPYDRGWVAKTLKALGEGGLLAEDGLLIIQHSVLERLEEDVLSFRLESQRRYGETLVSFLKTKG